MSEACPSKAAMVAAVELEIRAALGSVQTVVIGQIIQKAIDAKTDWQPIETAPKDGTVIDVWVKDNRGTTSTGRRYTGARWDNGWRWFDHQYDGRGAYVGLDNGVNVFVTHWMPLPAPPVEAKSD